jgi:hypothetical protein
MSFLSRIGKYVPTEKKQGLENLLTEWLAECLRLHFPLRQRFLAKLGIAAEDRVNILTQETFVDAHGVGYFDLSIKGEKGWKAVIEVKWGDSLREPQLRRYQDHIQISGAKVWSLTKGDVVGDYFPLTWRQIWRFCKLALSIDETNDVQALGQTMVQKLVQFLEEEGMGDSTFDLRMLVNTADIPTSLSFFDEAVVGAAAAIDEKYNTRLKTAVVDDTYNPKPMTEKIRHLTPE